MKKFLLLLFLPVMAFGTDTIPIITSVAPDSAWMSGGDTVFISKVHNVDTVYFGDSTATIKKGSTIDTAITKAYHTAGAANLIVCNTAGRDTLAGFKIYRFKFRVTKVISNGTRNRINQAWVGDGYTNADTAEYKLYVDSSIMARRGLMGDWNAARGMRPMKRYDRFFNFYRVLLISKESGCSATPGWGQPDTFIVNTPLKGTYDKFSLGWTVDSLTDSLWNHVRSYLGDTLHWKFVAIHTDLYRNSGGKYATFGPKLGFGDLLNHEISHSIHGLGDEYWLCSANKDVADHGLLNITHAANLTKWNRWKGYKDTDPTLSIVPWHCGIGDTVGDTIRYYQGAYYADTGQYRPTNNSKCNATWNTGYTVGWHAIAREKIIHDIYSIVKPVDSIIHDTLLTQWNPVKLQLGVIDTHIVKVEWYVGDSLYKSGGETFTETYIPKEPGSYTVRAHAYDEVVRHMNKGNSTPDTLDYIRDNDTANLVQDISWNIVVSKSLKPKKDFTYTMAPVVWKPFR